MKPVPTERVHQLNKHPVCNDGDYVLYWMIANRRLEFNSSLQYAVNLAEELG